MKIKYYHWIISFASVALLYYLFSDRSSYALGKAFGTGIGACLILLIVLAIVQFVSLLFKTSPSPKSFTRLFYIILLLLLIRTVSNQSMAHSGLQQAKFIENCVAELEAKRDSLSNLYSYNLEDYCSCAAEKARSIKLVDTAKYSDPNSIETMELYGPCWELARIKIKNQGVKAGMPADTLRVLNFAGSIQIKVVINGEEVFMLFDSGASDVLISRTFLSRFTENSQVQYLDEYNSYSLADGSELKVQMAIVQSLDIGKYSLSNFKVGVAEDVTTPLLGKSVLDLFSSWTINSENQLILQP